MKHVHLIGICGSGLSAIARLLLERGVRVTGSDRQLSPLAQSLEAAGAQVWSGHDPEHVHGANVVVRSSAIPDENVEVQAALKAGIPVLKRAEFLGELVNSQRGIAVAGTHGKTTTTAMIAWLLTALDQDPSYIIGGISADLGGNAHAGQGPHFVIEADEYDGMFLGLRPEVAVVTNVEHDHPDCYPTETSYIAAFEQFVAGLAPSGTLLVCSDDPGAARLLRSVQATGVQALAYGIGERGSKPAELDYVAYDLAQNDLGGITFQWAIPTASSGPAEKSLPSPFPPVALQVPGRHNVRNALAALAVAHQLQLPLESAANALAHFHGTGRRFELRGEASGVVVIDDYAHHPTEIRVTLAAARMRYPGRRLWAVWQPHTYSRTRTLFSGYVDAFADADRLLVLDIYAAREAPPADGFSSVEVVAAMDHCGAAHAGALEEARDRLLAELRSGDVLLVLSAGDADKLSTWVLDGLRKRSIDIQPLQGPFGERLQAGVSLARYTSARVGGPADGLLEIEAADTLAEAAQLLWERHVPFLVLGGGSNVLVSDLGFRGIVLLNRARAVRFMDESDRETPMVWAESGANFGLLARQAAVRGLSGLEWAAGIPGTLGGAVVGNAGAHDGDMAGNLITADILHLCENSAPQRESWPVERLEYRYRGSRLKYGRGDERWIVLAATLRLDRSESQAVQARIERFTAQRRKTQPPGATMGSMFKNPPGDFAGRLIDAAGLKGRSFGGAQISELHANFFVNHGEATAADIWELMEIARREVSRRFGVSLEAEVERVGAW